MVKIIAASAALLALIGCAHAQAPAQPPQLTPPPPPTCEAAAHRAFDFWLGEWRAYVTGTENLAGLSSIRSEDAGCVITEHWRSQRSSFTGRSLNIYDRNTGRWEQFWVDSTGDITHFVGGPLSEGGMRLTAENDRQPGNPAPVWNRMTFTRNSDGSVRQHGEQSTDSGATWTTTYDFTYRRAAN